MENFFNGLIDGLPVYTIALADAEVKNLIFLWLQLNCFLFREYQVLKQ